MTNKFGAKKCVIDGVTFDSQAEGRRYLELKLLCQAHQVRNLTIHQRFGLFVRSIEVGVYVADFCYDELDGQDWRYVVEDVKGMKTPVYKLKAKIMLACHGITIRETLGGRK